MRQLTFILAILFAFTYAHGADRSDTILTPLQQRQVDGSVDRALAWLMSTQQRSDGSFNAPQTGQPGITSLCMLALLSRGHLPNQGKFGAQIDRAIEYILSRQRPDGMICADEPEPAHVGYGVSHTAIYNHAVSSLALCEAYGMAGTDLAARMRPAIEKAKSFTLAQQASAKQLAKDRGGWRYLRVLNEHQSDLSVTSWQLLFLRSARNAGFDVPADRIEQASQFIGRCFHPEHQTFEYIADASRPISRGMAGAGILSMSLAGKHGDAAALAAGQWVLAHPFVPYNVALSEYDRYFYSLFYCTQAMYQLGGRYWAEFFPAVVDVLLEYQSPKGCWDAEAGGDAQFGNAYTTALCVLALDTPHQLLPIFQR